MLRAESYGVKMIQAVRQMRTRIGDLVQITFSSWPENIIKEGILIAAVADDTYGHICVGQGSNSETYVCRGDRTTLQWIDSISEPTP